MGVAAKRIAFTHCGCLLVLYTGVSGAALATAAVTYAVRMFGVTAGYHRYFSHAAFRTSRAFQFVLALLGAASGQRGPLWWASWHRRHHRDSDTGADVHSPVTRGFWWAHIGWLASDEYLPTETSQVPDLARFPELVWLDRHYAKVVACLIAALLAWGALLAHVAPHLGTSPLQMVAWGFFVSTVCACHAVMGVNSIGHWVGTRAFDTGDASRNNWLLAVFTFGDGWHNNHHRYPGSARHGLTMGQFDPNWLILRALAACGVVWDLREPGV
jgi:stearoyl-CoA desaturase (delta-9 desaturase)